MRRPEILSTPVGRAAAGALAPPALVFDACQIGVVLRAMLYVLAVTGTGLMYVADDALTWLLKLELVAAGALPATLLWLVVGCGLKKWLARLSDALQWAAGVALGAGAGLCACGALALVTLDASRPWLASACTGALLGAGLVAGLAWRVRGRTPAATAARLVELQSRIRPHFLFNTLNTAAALVREEPDKAELVLEDLAELFRHALSDPRERSTLAQELELARQYLEIEQVRFGSRLRVRWDLDARAGCAQLPPLILQPLVENAIKHGVEPSPDGADLRIRTRLRGRLAAIEVSNTLPAGQGAAGHGLALKNVRDRLRLLHDLQSTFRAGLSGDVYRARIEVPLSPGGGA